jgi:hypothetical protein
VVVVVVVSTTEEDDEATAEDECRNGHLSPDLQALLAQKRHGMRSDPGNPFSRT